MAADWRQVYFDLIADIRKRDRYLNAWEADFLDSIEGRLNDSMPLTDKQQGILDNIFEKVTRNG